MVEGEVCYVTGQINTFTISKKTHRIKSREKKKKARETQSSEKKVGKVMIKKKKKKN